jgi:Cys-tRNA synthase (O-phospho-L-seryl-tRNA:Cys-tRNA synthase)
VGTLDQPVKSNEAFPVVNKALHQWQEEMQKARDQASDPAPYPQMGSRPPAGAATQ